MFTSIVHVHEEIPPTVQLCSFHPVLKLFNVISKLDSSLIRQIFRNLSSYSVAGKIAVITGPFQGIDIIVAHACVWAQMSHMILVGPQESTLMIAKAQLKVTVDECGTSTRVHAHTADSTDIGRVASIFFRVRRQIDIPDLLILCTPSRFSSRLVNEYAVENIVRHFKFLNARHPQEKDSYRPLYNRRSTFALELDI